MRGLEGASRSEASALIVLAGFMCVVVIVSSWNFLKVY